MFDGLIERVAERVSEVLFASVRSGLDAKRAEEIRRLQRRCAYYKGELKKARRPRETEARKLRAELWEWRCLAWKFSRKLDGVAQQEVVQLDKLTHTRSVCVGRHTIVDDAAPHAS